MSIKPLAIKKNDLQPYYYFEFTGVDLTGSTVVVTMVEKNTYIKAIDRQSVGIFYNDSSNGDNILIGKGHYEWQSGETGVVGGYFIEFEVTPVSGGKFTFPTKQKALINIVQDLDNT